MEKSYLDKLVALKNYIAVFIVVRQDVNNLESYVVVQEVELVVAL